MIQYTMTLYIVITYSDTEYTNSVHTDKFNWNKVTIDTFLLVKSLQYLNFDEFNTNFILSIYHRKVLCLEVNTESVII